jgi:hypothetical protein
MVSHAVRVQGVRLSRWPPHGLLQVYYDDSLPDFLEQSKPTLLQINDEDFPARFLTDMEAGRPTPGSTIETLPSTSTSVMTLYQPVHRILHVALLQLTCDTVCYPRLDPKRVESAGVVIRRIVRKKDVDQPDSRPVDRPDLPPSAWMRAADGQFQWVARNELQGCEDPDPKRRPQLQSGQGELDRLLARQALANAKAEIYTPAFVAPPAVCDAVGRTLVYAVLPTASSDVSTTKPAPPQYDPSGLVSSLSSLLLAGPHNAPMQDQDVDYRYMSDDYANAHSGASFQPFSLALRMMHTVFGAFENTPQAQSLIAALNKHNVYIRTSIDGTQVPSPIPMPMGVFYQRAAEKLLDYDQADGNPGPPLTMPYAWDAFTDDDQTDIVSKIAELLQARSMKVTAPMGRFQDASRLYRIRVFLRIKSEIPGCPAKLVWSDYSNPFRIAAWHESAGRMQPPVPLPDPTDRNFLKNTKPNCYFAVPAGLMNTMQASRLSELTAGSPNLSQKIQLNWICGFSIPLITICAFFVLNIFLTLLNLVFFWLPFIKICIPFPGSTPANSGDADGT